MLQALSDRPDAEKLERFLQRLRERYGDRIAFVVLFGSMARGDWSRGSDYDVLIGLDQEDDQRLIDRMYEFSLLAEGNIEVFPYALSQWRWMFQTFHPLLLEVLEHGIVLLDRGEFARMRQVFQRWRAEGIVIPSGQGWRIRETVEEPENLDST